jgi:hypothetical protein
LFFFLKLGGRERKEKVDEETKINRNHLNGAAANFHLQLISVGK